MAERRGWTRLDWWILGGLFLVGLAIRLWRLGEPNEIVFDETYYAKWGQDYLEGEAFFDVHPPLGKLLIAVGIAVFGFDSFGWRSLTALFGALIGPLTYLIGRQIFASRLAAGLAGLFTLLDGLLLVQTRTALLDSFLIVFNLGAIASFFGFSKSTTRKKQLFLWLLTGIFIGLAAATKWTAAAVWLLLVVWYAAHRPSLPKLKWGWVLLAFLVLPAGIYSTSFVFNHYDNGFWTYLWDWHKQTWNFHHTLTADHPYASRWWSWLYLARPVWFYFKNDDGLIRGILALGNPILWWGGSVALLVSLWTTIRRQTPELLFPLLLFFALYLPWTVISRTQFQYYIVPAVPFLFLLLGYWLSRLLKLRLARPYALLFIIVALAIFIFFFPLYTALPISNDFYQLHVWFRSWI